MSLTNASGAIIVPVDLEKVSVDDGRFILDPHLLPAVCPHCGETGSEEQRIRIKAPYDWNFWFGIVGLLGVPLLFGIGAAVVSWIFGNEVLQEYISYGAFVAIIIAALGGLQSSRSNRENWFLTYYFCRTCSQEFKRVRFKSRLLIGGVIAILLIMMSLTVIQSRRLIDENSMQIIAWAFLVMLLSGIVGIAICRFRMAACRAVSARWMRRRAELRILFANHVVEEVVKSRLNQGS